MEANVPYTIAANGKLDLGLFFWIGALILILVAVLSTVSFNAEKHREQSSGSSKKRRKSVS